MPRSAWTMVAALGLLSLPSPAAAEKPARGPRCDRAIERREAEREQALRHDEQAFATALEAAGLRPFHVIRRQVIGQPPAPAPNIVIAPVTDDGEVAIRFAVDAEGNLYQIEAAPRIRSRARYMLCGCGPSRGGMIRPPTTTVYELPADRPFQGTRKIRYDARVVKLRWTGRTSDGRRCSPPPSAAPRDRGD